MRTRALYPISKAGIAHFKGWGTGLPLHALRETSAFTCPKFKGGLNLLSTRLTGLALALPFL
jgi:hypothetical protein